MLGKLENEVTADIRIDYQNNCSAVLIIKKTFYPVDNSHWSASVDVWCPAVVNKVAVEAVFKQKSTPKSGTPDC